MAIKPYNYANPQKPLTSSGGSIKPFTYKKYVAPAPKPSKIYNGNVLTEFGSRVSGIGKSAFTALLEAPAPKSFNMQEALRAGWNNISTTIQDTASRLKGKQFPNISQPKGVQAQNAIDAASAGIGLVNTAFLGITAPLQAARGLPVVGYAADAVHNFFSAVGTGGAEVASNATDGLLFLTPEQREKIRPLAMEVGALVTDLVVGRAGETTVTRFKAKSKELAETVGKEVDAAKPVAESAPTIKPFDYSKIAAKESVPVDAKRAVEPVAQDMAAIETKLAEVVAKLPENAPKPVDFATRTEFVKELDTFAKTSDDVKVQEAVAQYKDIASKATELPATKAVDAPKANEFNSRVFERLKIEQPEALKGDLTYERVNLKADAERAVSLIEKDRQEAFDIAMGQKSSADVTSTAVNIALAEKALADGQNTMYARLIRNRSLAQTRRGQEIVSERGSITDNSTSTYVKELLASRLDALGKDYLSGLQVSKRVANKTKATKRIDDEVAVLEKKIKAKKLDVPTALGLLDKLACV